MAKEKSVSECNCNCCSEKGMKAHGIVKIVLGLLVLANAYWPVVSWPAFIGIIILLAGIAKLMHNCK